MRDSISTYDVIPYKLLDLLCCDCGQWLSLYPFYEIVNANNEEFHLSFFGGEWSQDVYSPFCEWPRGEYGVQLFLFLVNEIAMFLTWYAFLDEGLTICLHDWLEVTGYEYSGSHGPCP